MENDAANLYCPNELCQAPNPLTHKFCSSCRTPLPRRYLWAVGDGRSVGNAGEVLADRYLVLSNFVLLDTKPGLVPQTPELENLQALKPYLRLIPYRLHLPQVYGVLSVEDESSTREILLLEKPPLFAVSATSQEVQLCSQLTTAWRDATSMRQLHWLWQIANLWQPLASEGVVSSLLDPLLLRVEGTLVRLLELRPDPEKTPDLPELGEFWQQLLPQTKPAIAEFLKEICHYLIQGKINSPEQLIEALDKGLAEVGRSQKHTVKITTKTDTGPSRQRNEDACYPSSGTTITKPPHPIALGIVCDGIGGHEGGNVASNLAIETLQQQVQQLTKVPYDHVIPANLLTELELAAALANDKISQRNDSENRQGRQRMGTTLVMGLPIAHEIYVTHVGDSRAYWITKQGCYQVTLDDDVASREVRLGYAVYREALLQGASGSLVQALGMGVSTSLHPTAQRFIFDEDCVFLLCSDGLSDFDRVEQYWETDILPILTEGKNVVNVADRLIEIANKQNGHDNVTIALIHYQVKYSEPQSTLKAVIPERSSRQTADYSSRLAQTKLQGNPNQRTQVLADTAPSTKSVKVPLQLAIISLLIVAGGILGYWLTQLRSPLAIPNASPTSGTQASPGTASPQPLTAELTSGRQISIKSPIVFRKTPPPQPNSEAIALAGSLLEVIDKKPNSPQASSQNYWVHLRVCSIGEPTPPNTNTPLKLRNPLNTKTTVPSNKPTLKPGEEVWIQSSQLKSDHISIPKSGSAISCSRGKNTTTAPAEESSGNPPPITAPDNQISPPANTNQTDSSTEPKNR
ncbi:MAG: protein phosphatase 2C domain-containing protein [Heteroscytonema crispum UTEX LB 1556]